MAEVARTDLSWTAPQKQVALAWEEVENPSVAPPAGGKNGVCMGGRPGSGCC